MAFNKEAAKASGNTVSAVRKAPALDPESPNLTQPYKDFVSKGWIHCVSIEFTPLGYTCSVKVSSDVTDRTEEFYAPGRAKQMIIDANLWVPRGTKKEVKKETELRPKRSLVKRDFLGTQEELVKRAVAVAAALGDTTARGRIGSLNLMRDGVKDFDEWWKVAPPSPKARLLSDKKHYDEFSTEDKALLGRALSNCPFRGTVPTPKEEEEDQEEEQNDPTGPTQPFWEGKAPARGV
jgi:hypothetical protein